MRSERELAADRRKTQRFPIERDVRFKEFVSGASGTGTTVNISSSGVLFTTDCLVMPGGPVEVSIDWPVKLNAVCPLQLVIQGQIVRTEQGQVAMQMRQYQFRTMRQRKIDESEKEPLVPKLFA